MTSSTQLSQTISAELDQHGTGTISKQDLLYLMERLLVKGMNNEELNRLLVAAGCEGEWVNYRRFMEWLVGSPAERTLSLPKAVAAAGGVDAWNRQHKQLAGLLKTVAGMCKATTVAEVIGEVEAITWLGHDLKAYAYMRQLYEVNMDLFYAALMAEPALLLPIVYTPTVGEACQKFGMMPFNRRGCYLSICDRGKLKQVLEEYAEAELMKDKDGKYLCDCIVFTDGGRILGLGDLGAWGMGIPIGKLDLYTVAAGVNPHRTIPVIIDAGIAGPEGNSGGLAIRDHELYTGVKQPRVTHKNEAGAMVNSAYYGKDNMIKEFFDAATDLFGKTCLLQYEDFNTNDAFPLLEEYREQYLTYNDDIQGTAAVVVAALLGALRIRDPSCQDLRERLRKERFLFHGAGSANLGVMKLLQSEAGVPVSSIYATHSGGLIWASEDGTQGNAHSDEQRAYAKVGQPDYDSKDLLSVIEHVRPSVVVGAVGVCPNCFTKAVVEAMVKLNDERPVMFALSNPKSQAELNAQNAYTWSGGRVIFGSGTWFPPVEVEGRTFAAGQVNNVYIFPGVSFGAVCCQASSIPEGLFLSAAEAVVGSLDAEDLAADSVVPRRDRIREVSLDVATAVVLAAQKAGVAGRHLGNSWEEVKTALAGLRWTPRLPSSS